TARATQGLVAQGDGGGNGVLVRRCPECPEVGVLDIWTKRPKGTTMDSPLLKRTTFRTSRELDFFAENKLVAQTGFERALWHLVIVQEAIDNALDAAEEADGVSPVVEVLADPAGITVRDNGPGLLEATLSGALDFSVRVSSREAYVSPSRGAQGNA